MNNTLFGPDVAGSRLRMLRLLRRGGMLSDFQMAVELQLCLGSARAHRGFLVKIGLVRECGKQRSMWGRPARLWEAV